MHTDVLVLDQICNALKRRESWRRAVAWTELGIGLGLTLGLPALIAGASIFGELEFRSPLPQWMLIFAILAVVMLVAYYLEWQTRGNYLLQRLREIGKNDVWHDTLNDRYFKYEERRAAVWWECWLFIPRIVFEAVGTLRAMQLVNAANRDAAAGIIAKMLAVDGAFQVDDLRVEFARSMSALDFDRSLAYLIFFQWLAAGDDGQRVWMGKTSRDELAGVQS